MERVVIIGGGFAGSLIAKSLMNKVAVTLIDTEDFFEYTPSILRTIVEPGYYNKINSKHKSYLPNAKIITGHVKSINNKFATLKDRKKINFDYLVIASGSNYATPIKEEDTFFANRVKHLLEAYEKIKKSKKISIVGGGVVGVELAAELCTHYKGKEINLIHAHSNLMERNNKKTSDYVKSFLEKNGVKIVFNEKIIRKEKNKLLSNSGNSYEYDSVFFTIGIKPNTEFMKGSFSNLISKGIEVNEFLQLKNHENIFVAGDVTNIAEEKTAQNAEKQAKIVASNILSRINNSQLKPYKSAKRMMVISLGKKDGIIEYKNFVFTGFITSIVKKIIEKKVMNQFS